jgi:hypothetical protein
VAEGDVASRANNKAAAVIKANSLGWARCDQFDCINNGTHLVTHKDADGTEHGEGKIIGGQTIA